MSSLVLELALRTGLSTADVERIAANAPKRYKTYEIDKRSGGTRTIAQPSRELKAIQRTLVEILLNRMPVHRFAMAYEIGTSISENASIHAGRAAILKLDFRDFFSSIKVVDFRKLLIKNNIDLHSQDIRLAENILFWGRGSFLPLCLSIGAPSSPKISNLVMYDLDCAAEILCAQLGVTFTRYADDITVSAKTIEALTTFEREYRKLVRDSIFPRLRFNNQKRGLYVRGQRQMVTGLILTPAGEVSIGRERKRLISSMIHRAKLGQLNFQDLARLRGLIAFTADCEPDFLKRMRAKYGSQILEVIITMHQPTRE